MKARLLLVILALTACEPRYEDTGLLAPETIGPALASFLAFGDTSTLNLDSVAAGGWKSVYVFGPGSNPSTLVRSGDSELRQLIEKLSHSRTETLLVFRFHHGLHQGLLIPETVARFDSTLWGTSIFPNRALFIRKSGHLALRP